MNIAQKNVLIVCICSVLVILFYEAVQKEAVRKVKEPVSEDSITKAVWDALLSGNKQKTSQTDRDTFPVSKPKTLHRYQVLVETTPMTRNYVIRKSGYNQYIADPTGPRYSYKVYGFYVDHVLTEQECYDYVRNHPDKVTLIYSSSDRTPEINLSVYP